MGCDQRDHTNIVHLVDRLRFGEAAHGRFFGAGVLRGAVLGQGRGCWCHRIGALAVAKVARVAHRAQRAACAPSIAQFAIRLEGLDIFGDDRSWIFRSCLAKDNTPEEEAEIQRQIAEDPDAWPTSPADNDAINNTSLFRA